MVQPSVPVSVDDVIIAPDSSDGSVTPRATGALMALSQTLARSPDSAVQRLVDEAMRLTGAGSAGVSLVEEDGDQSVFRWIATAGEFERYRDTTIPRHPSPCGETLDRGRVLLMQDPARHYGLAAPLHVPVASLLLVPFSSHGRMVGTLWCAKHHAGDTFTDGDVRAVQDLTTFATAVLEARRRQAGPAAAA